MRPRLALLLPVVAAFAVAGCSKSIDTDKAEKFIGKTVTAQVGADVKSVKCPSGLTAKKGETFECTVTGADGTSGKAQVTEKDDQGNVSVSAPFVHTTNLEELMAKNIGEQAGAKDVKVDCPEIIVGKKGGTFDCSATSGKDKATVNVTQKDDQGNVNYKVQGQ
jgi:hypothetical protein